MILVDTSVWVDHLRRGVPALAAALDAADVLMHPFVFGELACGNLQDRSTILGLLGELPEAPLASQSEVLGFIEARQLMGRGIGFVDAHLLASVALAGDARLWTHDRRLLRLAAELGLSR